MQETCEKFRSKVEVLEQEKVELAEEMVGVKLSSSQTSDQVETFISQMEELNLQINSANQNLEDYKSKYDDIALERDQLQLQIESLTQTVERQELEITKVRESKMESLEIIQKQDGALISLKSEISSLKSENTDLVKFKDVSTKQVNALNVKLEELKADKVEESQKIFKIENELEMAASKYTDILSEY
jgi:DNA repair exonuclease SbcCD ATPase subunit